MRTRLEVFQGLDSRFRGNAFPWSPYPKLGFLIKQLSKAGDRTRTGDVQLGKLTFYH